MTEIFRRTSVKLWMNRNFLFKRDKRTGAFSNHMLVRRKNHPSLEVIFLLKVKLFANDCNHICDWI